jgi:hypothetical protein
VLCRVRETHNTDNQGLLFFFSIFLFSAAPFLLQRASFSVHVGTRMSVGYPCRCGGHGRLTVEIAEVEKEVERQSPLSRTTTAGRGARTVRGYLAPSLGRWGSRPRVFKPATCQKPPKCDGATSRHAVLDPCPAGRGAEPMAELAAN